MLAKQTIKLFVIAISVLFVLACNDKAPAPTTEAKQPLEAVKEAPKEEKVTFTKAPLKVGSVSTDNKNVNMNMKIVINVGGKTQEMLIKSTETSEKKVKVLASSDTAVTKIEIEYIKEETRGTNPENGKEEIETSPVQGKTFIVEAKDGQIVVTNKDGKAVDAKMAEIVKAEAQNLGKPDKTADFIPGPLKIGEVITPYPEVAAKMFGLDESAKEKMKLGLVSFTLTGTKDIAGETVGTFDVVTEMNMQEGPMNMKIALKGTLEMRTKDSMPLTLNLKGAITSDGKKVKDMPAMDVSGEMEIITSSVYQ